MRIGEFQPVRAGLVQKNGLGCIRWGDYDTFIEAFVRAGEFVAWVIRECSTMAVFNGTSGITSVVALTTTNTTAVKSNSTCPNGGTRSHGMVPRLRVRSVQPFRVR